MRFLAFALCIFFLIVCSSAASTDFSGTWVLDLRASTSPDALLKRLQISSIHRRPAAHMKLKAVYRQTPDLLVIISRGSGFSRTEQLHFNGPPESRTEALAGVVYNSDTLINRRRSTDHNVQLSPEGRKKCESSYQTKVTDAGTTLALDETMRVEGEAQSWAVQRIWRKSAK